MSKYQDMICSEAEILRSLYKLGVIDYYILNELIDVLQLKLWKVGELEAIKLAIIRASIRR